MNQLGLQFGLRHLLRDVWGDLLGTVNLAIGEVTLKEMAHELDVAGSSISNAQHDSPRHPFHAKWLLYLILKDPQRRVLHKLAELAGGEFVPHKPLTEGERLRKLESAIDSLPPEFATAIRRKAGL